MQDKKKIAILIGLIVVVAFVWMPKGRKVPPVPAQQPVAADKALPAQISVQRKRSEFSEWKRNPFLWPEEAKGMVAGLALSGIIWDETKPYAIINGEVLHTGDQVAGKTVKSIAPNQVILTDGQSDYTLTLE